MRTVCEMSIFLFYHCVYSSDDRMKSASAHSVLLEFNCGHTTLQTIDNVQTIFSLLFFPHVLAFWSFAQQNRAHEKLSFRVNRNVIAFQKKRREIFRFLVEFRSLAGLIKAATVIVLAMACALIHFLVDSIVQ